MFVTWGPAVNCGLVRVRNQSAGYMVSSFYTGYMHVHIPRVRGDDLTTRLLVGLGLLRGRLRVKLLLLSRTRRLLEIPDDLLSTIMVHHPRHELFPDDLIL
jgi:hypothetical protein